MLTDTVEEMVPAVNHDQTTKGKQGLGLEGARREVALESHGQFQALLTPRNETARRRLCVETVLD